MHCKFKIEYEGRTTSLLSWTEAMSCFSLSLPAGDACPGAVYGPKAICQGCYASIGRYAMPNVLDAQWTRFMWLRSKLRSMEGSWEAITTLANTINYYCDGGYFRFFDSGDVFSVKMAWAIRRICKLTPNVKHWLPTRSYHLEGPLGDAVRKLSEVKNLTVRPSALLVDKPAPFIDGLAAGSGVLSVRTAQLVNKYICPKSQKGGSCETNKCRRCWNDYFEPVYYINHGHLGRKVMTDALAGSIPALRAAAKQRATQLTIGATNE